jgi:hypothetical protein
MSKFDNMLPVKSKIETIIDIKPSKKEDKKYDAIIENKITKRTRVISFGNKNYEQFKDRIGFYKEKDHKDPERRKAYIARHSVNPDFKDGKYTANYLSREFLW